MSGGVASVDKQAEIMKDKGNLYFKKERLAAAIEAYTEATYYTDRALGHKKRNDWERVESDCRKALELDGGSLKAEEARKKKEAATKARVQQLKNVEEKYSKENLQKIHDRWRKIMRAAKTTELHIDIETFSECYDLEVDRKDSIIASLIKQMSEAEQQRQLAFSKHLEIVDGLMDMHRTRMKDMEEEFKENLQRLERSFELERQHITTAHEKQKKAVSKISEEIQADLKKKLEIAENILKLGRLNNKLELEQERIFPFDPLHFSSLHPSLMNMSNFKQDEDILFGEKDTRNMQEHNNKEGAHTTSNVTALNTGSNDIQHEEKPPVPFVTDESTKEVEEFEYLSKFHSKYNKVMLDKMSLESQKKALSSEVYNLKISLKGHLEGFTGSNDETVGRLKALVNEMSGLKETSKPSTINDLLRIMKR